MYRSPIFLLLSFVFALSMFSCSEGELIDVDEYIALNGLETTELDEGVHIVIKEMGNDVRPTVQNSVRINYEGRLTNGKVFDSNDNITFPLANLIRGWQIGLQEIGEGGSCQLIIPPSAGYGQFGSGDIPGNAALVFDIDLLEVL